MKYLGKISSVTFGYGGYQEVCFGLTLTFEFDSSGISTFIGTWGIGTKVDKHTKWTEADRDKIFPDLVKEINSLLDKAKVKDIYQLKGVPVEVICGGTGSPLESWRILEEVL